MNIHTYSGSDQEPHSFAENVKWITNLKKKKSCTEKRKHTVYRQSNERVKWIDKEKKKKIYQKYSQCSFSYSATIFIYIFHIHKKKSLSLQFFFFSFLLLSSFSTLCVCSLVFSLRFFHDSLNDTHILFFFSFFWWWRWFSLFVLSASMKNFCTEKCGGNKEKKKMCMDWHIECGCIQTRVLTSNTHVREIIYIYIIITIKTRILFGCHQH